ncbi:MAG: hypothetical protein MUC70_01490, partial [Bacteroidales bacterium]|nr:hypothetical protein [Bacteroidales bacterium]
MKIPLGTGPNYSFVSDRGFAVPERSVALLVEGLVGPGLSPDGQAVLSASDTGFVSRTMEGIYQVGGFSEGLPEGAVLQAGGDTHFVLGSARSTAATDDFSGHLRLT